MTAMTPLAKRAVKMDDALDVDVMIASPAWDVLPNAAAFAARAIKAAAMAQGARGGVATMLADDEMLRQLNLDWMGKDNPTNVLSFPAQENPEAFLGDIAISFESAAREARDQGKPLADHVAHLLVHGFLHLLGFDHVSDAEAAAMEARERAILSTLGVGDPYA